jgi:hypothetical protein
VVARTTDDGTARGRAQFWEGIASGMLTEDAAAVADRVIRGWGQVVLPGWRDLFCKRGGISFVGV